ncbi:major facilitator superfamily domain-containing protein [Aspergillus desertorum]
MTATNTADTIVDEKLHDPDHVEKTPQTFAIDNIQVDIRLIPMLAVLYLISHLDRANIGNATIEGLVDDLGMSGIQYNIVLSIFFIPYVPSNMLLKNFSRPSVYLGILITCWGIIMTLTGLVQNFAGLLAVRILLGVFELLPGAVYLCTFWYMPKELSTRLAIFYSHPPSAVHSQVFAAGIAQMNGIGGQEGWRWIFILEGVATVVLGVLCYLLLIDSPRKSGKWLAPEEIRYLELQHFIKEGGHFKEEKKRTNWKDVKATLLNWRMYLLAFILLAQSACSYGTKFFLPTITKAMGFRDTNAQLMTVPPYVAGAVSAVFFSKLSDRFYWRMPFVVIPLCLVVAGYAVMVSLHGELDTHVGPAFFAIILTTMGIYPIHPATTSRTANNLAPSGRRAIGLAFNICIGNIGGVVGTLIIALVLELSFKWANRRKERIGEEESRQIYVMTSCWLWEIESAF